MFGDGWPVTEVGGRLVIARCLLVVDSRWFLLVKKEDLGNTNALYVPMDGIVLSAMKRGRRKKQSRQSNLPFLQTINLTPSIQSKMKSLGGVSPTYLFVNACIQEFLLAGGGGSFIYDALCLSMIDKDQAELFIEPQSLSRLDKEYVSFEEEEEGKDKLE